MIINILIMMMFKMSDSEIWQETCFTCENNDGFCYGSFSRKITCKLLNTNNENIEQKVYIGNKSIGGSIPNACFRVPNTNKIYKKCKYYEKKLEV